MVTATQKSQFMSGPSSFLPFCSCGLTDVALGQHQSDEACVDASKGIQHLKEVECSRCDI